MKYLVTGGAGFIGSHLVDLLLSNKNQIIVVDDFSTGKIENLHHILDDVILIKERIQDINLDDFKDLDGIFHLGAQASVPISISDIYKSSLNNLDSSLKVIDHARKLQVPLIYASSSAIYGRLPLGNDENSLHDLDSPYALDKYTLEKYSNIAHKMYNLSSIGLRFFNVYGERQDASNPYSGVISIFTDRMLRKKSIIVNGGYQTRDFIHVSDIVKTIHASMKKASLTPCCEVLNVGTGKSISINHLVKILSKLTEFEPEIEYRDLPLGDPEKSEGTFNKLQTVLNIPPSQFVSLDKGLDLTMDYFRSEHASQ